MQPDSVGRAQGDRAWMTTNTAATVAVALVTTTPVIELRHQTPWDPLPLALAEPGCLLGYWPLLGEDAAAGVASGTAPEARSHLSGSPLGAQ